MLLENYLQRVGAGKNVVPIFPFLSKIGLTKQSAT